VVRANPWALGQMLTRATRAGDLPQALALLEAGAHDLDRDTALVVACRHGHAAIAKLLLECSANPTQSDRHGLSPLMWCARCNQPGCASLLIQHRADMEQMTPAGDTALIFACLADSSSCCQLLLERGASVDVADRRGFKTLRDAVRAEPFVVRAGSPASRREAALRRPSPPEDDAAQRAAPLKNGPFVTISSRCR